MIPSDVGNYAIVPEWLVGRVSPRALQLFVALGLHRNGDGVAFPSRRTLAARLSCGTTTVDDALNELVQSGAVEKRQRRREDGGKTSNEIRLRFADPENREWGRREPGDPTTDSSVVKNESSKPNERDLPSRAIALSEGREPSRARKRDVVFDALAEATRSDPYLEGTLIGKLVAQLRSHPDYADAKEKLGRDGADEALAAEIPLRAEAYRRHFGPGVELTAPALVKHWRRVAGGRSSLSAADLDRLYGSGP